ncbi:MAG TPA: glycosyltransferase [Candidatus Babeliales bacterium]|jgi:glycosyltransferase involved in cell wall biosynthesis|nr:glycosyltransferase [Candidatus Babeliales bacterium]
MTLRILYVTNNYSPYCGGVVHAINAAVDCLEKAGHQVFIVTLDFNVDCVDLYKVKRIWCPITFRLYQNHMAIPCWAIWYIEALLCEFKPDIIHTHHPFLLGNSALCLAKKYGIPIIFTYHTLYDRYAHYIPLPAMLVRPCIHYMVKRFCSNMHAIIAPSRVVYDHIKSITPQVRVEVLPSPIEDTFYPLIAYEQKSYIQLLVVSRFVPEKNLLILFDMLKLLPSCYHLVLVGYGYLYDTLQDRARTLHLTNRVQYIIKPEHTHLVALYQQADLFVFPSQLDTQGLVLAEAMACGLPVVALDGPGQRDIVIHNYNGFIVDSIAHMAHTIQDIMDNALLYKQLREGALYTAARYKKSAYTDALVQVYTQNIKNHTAYFANLSKMG